MSTKENNNTEFPYEGINDYLDKIYTKIEAYESDFCFDDFEYLTRRIVHDERKEGDKKRLIRDMGFQIGDGINKCEQTIPFKRALIRNLYLGLHINPGEFLLDENIEKEFLKKTVGKGGGKREEDHVYFTHDYWNRSKEFYIPNPLIQVKTIPLASHTETENDLTDFYEKIASRYKNASDSIIAHEVLFKGNNNNPQKYKTYRHAQNQIFEAIDKAINNFKDERSKNQNTSLQNNPSNQITAPVKNKQQNRTFSYQRVFYLSPSESIHKKNINTSSEMFKIMMIEASFETLQHIKNCFDNHSSPADKDICTFYVAPFSGLRAHTLIDDKILLSEDYKKHADYIKPHLIFIDNVQVKSDLQKMKKAFDLELEQKEEKKIHLLRKRDFPRYIRQAEKYLEGRIEEYENALDIIDGIEGSIGSRQVINEKTGELEIREYNIEDVTLNLTERIKSIINILQSQYFDVSNKRKRLT